MCDVQCPPCLQTAVVILIGKCKFKSKASSDPENAIGQSDLVADFAGNVEQKATHGVRPAGRES